MDHSVKEIGCGLLLSLGSIVMMRSLVLGQVRQQLDSQIFMMGLIAHELRSPISAIQLSLSVYRRENKIEQNPWLNRLDQSVKVLGNWSEALLGFTRNRSGRIKVVRTDCDVEAVMAEVAQSLEPMIVNKGLEFEVSAEPGIPILRTDPQLLRVVLGNLVQNAVKYTERGKISFRAGSGWFEVKDTGVGMKLGTDKSDLESFDFQDWLSIKSSGTGGWGLGLLIVKNLVRHLGARALLSSKPGLGTRIRIEFF